MWYLDTLFVSEFDLTLLTLCGTYLDELQVNLRDLRVGHGAQAEHLPE